MIKNILKDVVREYRRKRADSKRREAVSGFNTLNLDHLRSLKKSDTIFILGSGPSINKITKDQWNYIETHDSFGINSFLFHPNHIPNFYWYEFADRLLLDYYKFRFLEKRSFEYRNVPFILNYNNFKRLQVSPDKLPKPMDLNYQFILPKSIPNYKMETLQKVYSNIQSSPVDFHSLIHVRGSVATCCLISICLGYKKIIFPGVDLKDSSYFYDTLKDQEIVQHREVFEFLNFFDGWNLEHEAHRNISPKLSEQWGMPPLQEILLLMESVFGKNGNVKMFSWGEDSYLNNYFPTFEID